MLIESHRHTPEDLQLWAAYEAADRLHGATLDRKIEDALTVVRQFAEQPCYAGISWGKDSVVLSHLIAISGTQIPCVWFRVEPICNPDCERVAAAFLKRWRIDYSEIVRHCTRDAEGWHATGTLESAAEEAEQLWGVRRMLGIRADESGVRRLTCLRNGTATANTCRPLAWWTAADVLGYLARYDLPVHPAYAMLGGGRYERERLRVASLGGRRGDGMGRAEWEREYYGDTLRRLENATMAVHDGLTHAITPSGYDRV